MTRIRAHSNHRPVRGGTQSVATVEPELLTGELRQTALEIVGRYPNPRSATLPLLFLVQSVEGYVTERGMREVADILSLKPAEVLATGSFYTMLKKKPQGEYLISVCRNISCTHLGARKVIDAVERHLGIEVGGTTSDGKFTLETAECLATCDGAPSLQINYEDFYNVDPNEFVTELEKLRRGDEVLSVRGERVLTASEISREIATIGLRSPGTAGDIYEPTTFGGEDFLGEQGPGTRPKETGGKEGDYLGE
jgi:NADH-quinone oxidoreductase subunit E